MCTKVSEYSFMSPNTFYDLLKVVFTPSHLTDTDKYN